MGTGRVALPLSPRVGSYTGVDLSTRMMAVMDGSTHSIRRAQADATRLPFATNTFDRALASHIFHLIPDYHNALAELARVLKPEGLLILVLGGVARPPEVSEALSGTRGKRPGVSFTDMFTFLLDYGWEPVAEAQHVTFTAPVIPADAVRSVRGRHWSGLWERSEEEIEQAAQTLEAALRAAYEDIEEPVAIEGEFSARAYRYASSSNV
ncbi:MAG: class I SAM-dependent methyltransferase [Anaerolineae bacterium]